MSEPTRMPPVTMRDVNILFRNFEGKEKQYNRAGDRNFSVELPPNVAAAMLSDGWSVKQLREREDGEPGTFHLPVAVSYRIRPPRVYLVTSKQKTLLTEDEVTMLDWVDIAKVDLTLNPSPWEVQGKSGIKAYLMSAYITIIEDELDMEYSDLPQQR